MMRKFLQGLGLAAFGAFITLLLIVASAAGVQKRCKEADDRIGALQVCMQSRAGCLHSPDDLYKARQAKDYQMENCNAAN